MKPLNIRQRVILRIFREFGGIATAREIAKRADLSVNGTCQTLNLLSRREDIKIKSLGGKGGDKKWQLYD